jgi:hypothetical protein
MCKTVGLDAYLAQRKPSTKTESKQKKRLIFTAIKRDMKEKNRITMAKYTFRVIFLLRFGTTVFL